MGLWEAQRGREAGSKSHSKSAAETELLPFRRPLQQARWHCPHCRVRPSACSPSIAKPRCSSSEGRGHPISLEQRGGGLSQTPQLPQAPHLLFTSSHSQGQDFLPRLDPEEQARPLPHPLLPEVRRACATPLTSASTVRETPEGLWRSSPPLLLCGKGERGSEKGSKLAKATTWFLKAQRDLWGYFMPRSPFSAS